MTTQDYNADVVIVGAGPAGATAAAQLAARGWRVLLADRARFPRDKTCGDGLTPRAVAALDRQSVLPDLLKRGYSRINRALVSAPRGTVSEMPFAAFGLGLPAFGLVVPRFELDDILLQHALARGARLLSGVHITQPLRAGGQVIGVAGNTGQATVTVRAPLTILATGASISLLRAFGIVQQMPSGFNAIRGYFAGIPDLSDAFEFYFDQELRGGYGWVFPLADGRANVGLGLFTRDREQEAPNTRRMLAEFMARHPRLAQARPDGPLKGYPLRTDFPGHPAAGAGFLLAGESLGLVHPVTGEGIDLALESAELAAAAADAALRGHDPARYGPAHYRRALLSAYGGTFRGLHVLQHLLKYPRALDRLLRQTRRKPYLAYVTAGINLGMVQPWAALRPRVWWDLFT